MSWIDGATEENKKIKRRHLSKITHNITMSPLHKNSGECSYFDGEGWLHLTTADTLVSADIAWCKLNIQNLQRHIWRGERAPIPCVRKLK